jgi:molecular chaperone GrpE
MELEDWTAFQKKIEALETKITESYARIDKVIQKLEYIETLYETKSETNKSFILEQILQKLELIQEKQENFWQRQSENLYSQLNQKFDQYQRIDEVTIQIQKESVLDQLGQKIKGLQAQQEEKLIQQIQNSSEKISQDFFQKIQETQNQFNALSAIFSGLEKLVASVDNQIQEKVIQEINKMGKTLFKISNSMDSSCKNFENALLLLEKQKAESKEEWEKENEQNQKERESILEDNKKQLRKREIQLAQDMFSLIDGLEAGMETGEGFLKMQTKPSLFSFFKNSLPKEAIESWLGGMKIMHKHILNILASLGVEPILSLHCPFDPHLHKAVSVEKGPENTIVKEITKGYKTQNQILRYAEVVVGKNTIL